MRIEIIKGPSKYFLAVDAYGLCLNFDLWLESRKSSVLLSSVAPKLPPEATSSIMYVEIRNHSEPMGSAQYEVRFNGCEFNGKC